MACNCNIQHAATTRYSLSGYGESADGPCRAKMVILWDFLLSRSMTLVADIAVSHFSVM